MNIIGTKINTSRFVWEKIGRKFTVEASSLFGVNFCSRVFDDSYDEGFILVSQKTNNEVIMVLSNVERREGDIMSWTFTPFRSKVDFTVVIFND